MADSRKVRSSASYNLTFQQWRHDDVLSTLGSNILITTRDHLFRVRLLSLCKQTNERRRSACRRVSSISPRLGKNLPVPHAHTEGLSISRRHLPFSIFYSSIFLPSYLIICVYLSWVKSSFRGIYNKSISLKRHYVQPTFTSAGWPARKWPHASISRISWWQSKSPRNWFLNLRVYTQMPSKPCWTEKQSD